MRILFIIILACALACLPMAGLTAPDQRIALVIGNGAYKSAPLKNSVNDAIDFANSLHNLGFSVILKTNASMRTMEESIRDFGKRLRSGGVGLFYFAGHGMQVQGRNYLIPTNADIESEADIKYESVDAGRILAQMEHAGNGLNIVILDACRDNPFSRDFRSSNRGLAKMDAPVGSFIAYATSPGSVAADGDGRNGLYTSKLLKNINTLGLPIELLFKEVRRDVMYSSQKRQIPWTESSLVGDFYFLPKRELAITNKPPKKEFTSNNDTPMDNSNLANLDTNKYNRQDFKNRYKLAIFPWHLKLPRNITHSTFYDCSIDGIYDTIQGNDNIELRYSYYKHNRLKYDVIKPTNVSEIEKVWYRNNLFSTKKIDIDKIVEYGEDLNVDVVILIQEISAGAHDFFSKKSTIYLVNIRNKKVFKESVLLSRCPQHEVSTATKRLFHKLLSS